QEIGGAMWPTILLVGISTLLSTVFGIIIGIYGAWRRELLRQEHALRLADPVLDAGGVARHAAAGRVRRQPRLVPHGRVRLAAADRRHRAHHRRPEPPVPSVHDAHARLHRRVRGDHALVPLGGDR